MKAKVTTGKEPVGDGDNSSQPVELEAMDSEAGEALEPSSPSVVTGVSIPEFAMAYGLPAGYLVSGPGFELGICDDPWHSILGVEGDSIMSSKGDESIIALPLRSEDEAS